MVSQWHWNFVYSSKIKATIYANLIWSFKVSFGPQKKKVLLCHSLEEEPVLLFRLVKSMKSSLCHPWWNIWENSIWFNSDSFVLFSLDRKPPESFCLLPQSNSFAIFLKIRSLHWEALSWSELHSYPRVLLKLLSKV